MVIFGKPEKMLVVREAVANDGFIGVHDDDGDDDDGSDDVFPSCLNASCLSI